MPKKTSQGKAEEIYEKWADYFSSFKDQLFAKGSSLESVANRKALLIFFLSSLYSHSAI